MPIGESIEIAMEETAYDVLVIGAGPSGLCAAKTFLESEPGLKIGLIDSNTSLGGVWAKEHLYFGLKTNNLRGTLDFTDFPMDDSFGVAAFEHVSGDVMHNYFLAYARKWDLLKRILFNTTVVMVERDEVQNLWKLTITNNELEDLSQSIVWTRKLIVATGITNAPYRPGIPGQGDFEGPVIHSSDLGWEQGRLTKDPSIKTVAVLGGGKSAYDAVYLAAHAGKDVEWVIRRSGRGPTWVFPAFAQLGPFKAWREKLVTRRIISFLSPCIFGAVDGFGWIRGFLHSTALGKLLSQAFWSHIHHVTLDDCGYRTNEMYKLLEPEQSPFWYGTATGVYSYTDDFYSFIRSGHVRLHREDISHLSPTSIHLSSGTKLTSHALITATGYSVRPTIQFHPPALAADLGVPTLSTALTSTQSALWARLDNEADTVISTTYPRLLKGPFRSPSSKTVQPYNLPSTPNSDIHYTPYRLYRSIAPPLLTVQDKRSIAFVGYVSNIANTTRLEIQCLWAYAYLTDQLVIDKSTVFEEAALLSRFCRFRAPYGHGRWYPDLNFDQLPFFDMLLKDLGLRTWRKANILRELFEPYGWEDYRGLVREWLSLQKSKGKSLSGAE